MSGELIPTRGRILRRAVDDVFMKSVTGKSSEWSCIGPPGDELVSGRCYIGMPIETLVEAMKHPQIDRPS